MQVGLPCNSSYHCHFFAIASVKWVKCVWKDFDSFDTNSCLETLIDGRWIFYGVAKWKVATCWLTHYCMFSVITSKNMFWFYLRTHNSSSPELFALLVYSCRPAARQKGTRDTIWCSESVLWMHGNPSWVVIWMVRSNFLRSSA